MTHKTITELKFKPLTRKNWDDFETLFGEKGASGGDSNALSSRRVRVKKTREQ